MVIYVNIVSIQYVAHLLETLLLENIIWLHHFTSSRVLSQDKIDLISKEN